MSINSDLGDCEGDSIPQKETERLELPKPDPENITVLTHNLPNKPILPWNRYDSPWEEAADREESEDELIEAKEEE